jgi:hypothetical protein
MDPKTFPENDSSPKKDNLQNPVESEIKPDWLKDSQIQNNSDTKNSSKLLTDENPQKKNFPILTIVMIPVLLAIGAFGVLAYQKFSAPKPVVTVSPTPTATTVPTVDWKTYTNSKYGFSFKYPSTFIVQYKYFNDDTPFVFLDSKSFNVPEVWVDGQVTPVQFSISSKSLSEYVDYYKKIIDPANYTQSDLTSPLKGYRFDGTFKLQGLDSEEYPLKGTKITGVVIQVPNSQKVLEISYDYVREGVTDSIFDQILSTFKFTNQNITKNEAEKLVSDLPEIKNLLAKYPNYIIDAEGLDQDSNWQVHVYLIVDEHATTYGWYDVNKSTGEIVKQN